MLSIDFIRNNKEKVAAAAKNKNRKIDPDLVGVDIEKILGLDEKRKEFTRLIQKLHEERNILARQTIDEAVKKRGKAIKEELKKLEGSLSTVSVELDEFLSYVPNVPLDEVPVGQDSSSNQEIRRWGKASQFDFKPRSHIELGSLLDIIDLERGVKVSGFRGYFLKNEGALLHTALLFYAFGKLAARGYTPLIAPSIVKGFTLFGSGQFPWGKDEVYALNDEDSYLAGTAEVPVTAYFAKEVLDEKDLPKKFAAFSPCFRKEAGSYGKDTKGLYRLHEFWKVEQVIIAPNDIETAKTLHEELQQNTEDVLQELGIAYRVLLMSTGDMGEPQIKKYDTEIWMPSRQDFGEIASNSIMGDFQARRLGIKYRKKDGKTDFCFTLNDTLLPSPRILIAILENYQEEDGSVRVPEAIQRFTGFKKISPKK